jgi:UDP-glucose 4-epimerase
VTPQPTLKGKRVLVTGGAGFIGSHLVDRIVRDAPERVVVVDNLYLGREENLEDARSADPDLVFHRQDATDYEAMERLVRDERIDSVFNLAVVPLPASLVRPRWTVEQNVAITTVLCELLRLGTYGTLIHFSSSEAYGSAAYVPMDEAHPSVPSTPYAASKVGSDHIVLSYWHTFGLDAAIIRPFNNFGPRQNSGTYAGIIPIVVERALRGEPIDIYGDGEQTRDFVFVRDTADAAVGIHAEPVTRGRIINIASGREVSVNRLVAELLDVLGVEVPVRHVAPRPGDVRRHLASIELARELIGFAPATTLRQGLVETVAWYQSRKRQPA